MLTEEAVTAGADRLRDLKAEDLPGEERLPRGNRKYIEWAITPDVDLMADQGEGDTSDLLMPEDMIMPWKKNRSQGTDYPSSAGLYYMQGRTKRGDIPTGGQKSYWEEQIEQVPSKAVVSAPQIRRNLYILSKTLMQFSIDFKKHWEGKRKNTIVTKIRLTSTLRWPEYNAGIGGDPESRHMFGLASDVKIIQNVGGDQLTVAPFDVQRFAEIWAPGVVDDGSTTGGAPTEPEEDSEGSGALPFANDVGPDGRVKPGKVPVTPRLERARTYPRFTHVTISKVAPRTFMGEAFLSEKSPGTGRTSTPAGIQGVAAGGLAGEYASNPFYDIEGDEQEGIDIVGGIQLEQGLREMYEQLGLREDTGIDYETARLPGRKAPGPGEIDIGDLRFGAKKFETQEPADLNQPTAVSQQNAGSVATASMLRADMDAVLSDSTVLPEVITTLTINATTRDDVNARIRPLVAMQKRMPFTAVRGREFARLMLGIGEAEDTRARLAELYPSLTDNQLDEQTADLTENAANAWIPTTIRQVNVSTQPGSAGLFQVHVVLRYANVAPYVPQLMFWKNTDDALKWARYLSIRSHQGAEIVGADATSKEAGRGSTQRVRLTNNGVIEASPPNLSNQTESPYESYPFRKFYRGLLEEYDPDLYGGEARDSRRPLFTLAENKFSVNEPAYKISDPARAFELYDAGRDIGLEYISIQNASNAEARLQRVVTSFTEQIETAEAIESGLTIAKLGEAGNIERFEDFGKISPFMLGPGRQFAQIGLSLQQTSNAYQEIVGKVQDGLTGKIGPLKSTLRTYGVDFEDGEAVVYEDEVPIDIIKQEMERKGLATNVRQSEAAIDIFRAAEEAAGGGVVDFTVPSSDPRTDIHVPFTEELRKLQKSIIQLIGKFYFNYIFYNPDVSKWRKARDGSGELLFNDFFTQQINKYKGTQEESIDKAADPKNWPDGFGRYMLTYRFIRDFYTEINKDDDDDKYKRYKNDLVDYGPNGNDRVHMRKVLQDFRDLFDAVQKITKSTYDAVRTSRASIEEYFGEQSDSSTGLISFAQSTLERVRIEFGSKLSDQEWDAYESPVTQHLGGRNAYITLEATTNNQLFLDKLGEIKRSQERLSNIRKSANVVPPVMAVTGRGNILRSCGIKHVAYRSHTVNMAKNNPGYYKVRIDLVQDEKTLARQEKLSALGGGRDLSKESLAVAPLTVPMRYEGKQDGGKGSKFYSVSAYEIFDLIYGDLEDVDIKSREVSIPTEEEDEEEDAEPLVSLDAYKDAKLTGGHEGDTRWVEDRLERVRVRIVRVDPAERDSSEGVYEDSQASSSLRPFRFKATFRFRGDGSLTFTKDVDLTPYLRPLKSFLEYADREMGNRDQFIRLVQNIEGTLSTSGGRRGLIGAWVAAAEGLMMNHDSQRDPDWAGPVPIIRDTLLTDAFWDGVQAGYELVTDLDMTYDNVTEVVRRLTAEQEDSLELNGTQLRQMPYYLAASEITAFLTSTPEVYSVYTGWLQDYEDQQGSTRIKYPYGAKELDRTFNPKPPGGDATEEDKEKTQQEGALVRIFAQQQRLATALPSAYEDLLMPKVVDSAQGDVAVLAPDFPFGPGTYDLNQDVIYERFQIADALRTIATTRMATLGFESAREYLGRTPKDIEENAHTLKSAVTTAMQNLKDIANSDGAKLPGLTFAVIADGEEEEEKEDIDPVDTGSQKTLGNMLKRMKDNKCFRDFPTGAVSRDDLVEAYRISKTFEYMAIVMEASHMQAGEALMSDAGNRINSNAGNVVKQFLGALREGKVNVNVDLSSAASVRENITEVSASSYIKRKRKELIKIYQSDPDAITRALGFHDRFSEPRRQALQEKLKRTWFNWKGMRRAFPSYMLLLTGKAGTGLFSTMSDRYSWTAVQSLDIVSNQDAAGDYATLILSNMRKRLRGEGGGVHTQILDRQGGFDQEMELRPGNHINIYTGYGPDIAHMKPFCGRVTSVLPGAQMKIEAASYSTTLNNPPSDGRGFFVDGWNGQQTIANAILYTISNTSGLEGLGRQSPGTALDAMGRTRRGFADQDFRASLMINMYDSFGTPFLGAVTGSAEADVGTIMKLAGDEYGVAALKSAVKGDPQIFENVYVTSDPERAGWGSMFGGLSDVLTGGKGWGWAALPGETAWAQLKDQAMLFTDYIVTGKYYNAHVPLNRSAKHPIRQTLYFGKKTGNYIYTSRQPATTQAFMKDEGDGWIEDELNQAGIGTNVYTDSSKEELNPKLVGAYENIFYRSFINAAVDAVGAGAEMSWDDQLGDWFEEYSGGFFGASEDTLFEDYNYAGGLQNQMTRRLQSSFPNLMQFINPVNSGLNLEVLIEKKLAVPPHPDESKGKENAALLLKEFQKDIRHLARQGRESVPESARDNPLIRSLYERALAQNLRPASKTRPIQEHHFVDNYRAAARTDITAGDDHPQFANRLTLSFPEDSDNRLSAYMGGRQNGSMRSYTLTASPLINEDFIVEDQVYYPNVRSTYREASGRIKSIVNSTFGEDAPNLQELTKAREDIIQKKRANAETVRGVSNLRKIESFGKRLLSDIYDSDEYSITGESPDKAYERISELLQKYLDELAPMYSGPKYSTVANNMLRDRFKHMYSGTLMLAGDPSIDPYHVLHTWDDKNEMFGPVEAQTVRHTMNAQTGFHTEVEPKLVTYVRGADEGLDIEWMGWAGKVSAGFETYNQLTGAAGQAAASAGRLYIGRKLISGAANIFPKAFSGNVIKGGLVSMLGKRGAVKVGANRIGLSIAGGPAAVIAYTAYEAISTFASISRMWRDENLKTYIGLMQGAMDANPIVFVPLTSEGQPYVGGLTGSTGPASLTEVTRDIINTGAEGGASVAELIEKLESTVNAGARVPTTDG